MINAHTLSTSHEYKHPGHFTAPDFDAPAASKASDIRNLPGNVLNLRRGEYLYQMGDSVNCLYIVCGGVLKSSIVALDGDEQVVAFYRSSDLLAFEALANGRASCNIMAIDSTAIRAIDRKTVANACRGSTSIQQQLLLGMSQEIHRLTGLLQFERLSAEERVAAFLVEQSNFESSRGCSRTDFILPMSRSDMGKYLNLTTETVSRTFSRLQEQGFLTTERRRVRLNNLAAIYQLARLV